MTTDIGIITPSSNSVPHPSSICSLGVAAVDSYERDEELKNNVVAVLPLVHSVNAMAKEMNRPVEFSPIVVSHKAMGIEADKPRVRILHAYETVAFD